jgi:hypothetical protein
MAATSFTITPTSGYVYGTEFQTVNTSPDKNVLRFVWDFGDDSNLNYTQQPNYTYQYPGTYNIVLSSIDINGIVETSTNQIVVDYFIRDYINFTSIPETYANPGKLPRSTFKFDIVSSQIASILKVNLFAANSKSIPYEQVKDYKWNFLIPTWKFLDKNQNFITSLNIETTPIYYNNKVVAVSGTGEFYYVDSTSTGDPTKNCPVLITTTLETSGFIYRNDSFINDYPSYANNKSVTTGVVWFVNDLTPDLLKISSNYIDEIYPHKWVDIKIPTMITCHSKLASKLPGADDTVSDILFSYPQTNTLGSFESLSLTLNNAANIPFDSSEQIIEGAPLYFQQTDSQNNQTGGYIFTSLTSKVSGTSITVSGSTTAFIDYSEYVSQIFPYPGALAPQPSVWVSNPSRNTLNRVTYLPYPDNCQPISYYQSNKLLVDGYIKQIDVPYIKEYSTYNYSMSGFSGIYGMAVDPRNYNVIATDSELDRIYKFDTTGVLVCSVSLSSIISYNPQQEGLTPASVSLDQDYSFWVSLFNSVSVLKFDKDFNFLFASVPNNLFGSVSANYEYVFDGDYVYKPPIVQTDKDSNCWVAYAHPLSSILMLYGKDGTLLSYISLPNNSVPVDLAINADNNLWVANSYNTTPIFGSIELYDTSTYTVISAFQKFSRPCYIALDRYSNLWFTHGIQNIGVINSITGEVKLWQVNDNSSDVTFNPLVVPSYLQPEEEQLDENIGGFAVDVYDRIWFINSYTNNAWVVPASLNLEQHTGRSFKIRPDSTIGYYTDASNYSTIIDTNPGYKSAQAFCDWTGNQWYQKYTNILNLFALPISGVSVPFDIFPFRNDHEIRKINDSFNTAGYFYSLALPEILKNNKNFFNNLLPGVVGDGQETYYQDMGRESYEKIANFTINHADVDTCNVNQLLSLADETKTPYTDYSLDVPADIKKLLDLTSIPHSKLWGQENLIPILQNSIGDQLNTFTDYVTADTFIILRNRYDNTLSLTKVPPPIFQTNILDLTAIEETGDDSSLNTIIYPLSVFEGDGFIQPVLTNYLFYNLNPDYPNEYIENIIDWDSEFTTLTPQQSTYEEWFGDNGIIEKNFNYYLTKNLIVE